MNKAKGLLVRHAARIAALLVIIALYVSAKLPQLSSEERAQLAGQYQFEQMPLPELSGYEYNTVRHVNPHLEHISAWISSVGAAVAINDLDGDGLSNDICWVDTRIDRVIVAPVPGTPSRFEPFVLDPAPLPYDDDTMAPMGCVPGDVNEDGAIDIIVYYWGRTPIAFLNHEDSFVPCEIHPSGERWFTNAATMADIDGDGHVDLVIGNYFQDGAHILDTSAHVDQEMQHSMSRAHNAGSSRFLLWESAVHGEEPSVTFTEAEHNLPEDVNHGWTLALGAADLDGDLLPELYFANDFGPDRLLHNQSQPNRLQFSLLEGKEGFATPSSCTLGKDSFKGMGVDFGEINGDGRPDIYVSNIAADYALHESHFLFLSTGPIGKIADGVAPYTHGAEKLGVSRSNWGWDSRLADFNNDGMPEAVQATGFLAGDYNRWPELQELAMGNDELLKNPDSWPRFQPGDDLCGDAHNPFFAMAGDGRYYDIAKEIGLGAPMVSRGIATADVDGDGDLDFAVANQWDRSYFYRNDLERDHSSVILRLLLPVQGEGTSETQVYAGVEGSPFTGRPAVGAVATIRFDDGRVVTAQVDGGNGHSGCRSSEIHFGLGTTSQMSSVAVDLKWRGVSGRIFDKILHLQPGRYTILLGGSREEEIS